MSIVKKIKEETKEVIKNALPFFVLTSMIPIIIFLGILDYLGIISWKKETKYIFSFFLL